jgi:hypothetical protein
MSSRRKHNKSSKRSRSMSSPNHGNDERMREPDGSGAEVKHPYKARVLGLHQVLWCVNSIAVGLENGFQYVVDRSGVGGPAESETVPKQPTSADAVVKNVQPDESAGSQILKPIPGHRVYNCATRKFELVPVGCGVPRDWVRRSERNLQQIDDDVAFVLNSDGQGANQGQSADGQGANQEQPAGGHMGKQGQSADGQSANQEQPPPLPPVSDFAVTQFCIILVACVTMAVMSFVFQPIYWFTVPQTIHFFVVVFQLTVWFMCILSATMNLVRYAGLAMLTTGQRASQILCVTFFIIVWYCTAMRMLGLMRSGNGSVRFWAELTGYAKPQSTGLPSIGQVVALVANLGYTNILQPTTVAKVVAIDAVTKVTSVESAQFTLWPTVLYAWSVVSPYVSDPNSWNLVSIPEPVVEAKTVVITKPGKGGWFWSSETVNETVVVEEDMWTKMWFMTQWYVSHGVPKILMDPIRFGSSLFTWTWTGLFYPGSRGVKGHIATLFAAAGVAIFPWCNVPISMFIGTAGWLLGRRV